MPDIAHINNHPIAAYNMSPIVKNTIVNILSILFIALIIQTCKILVIDCDLSFINKVQDYKTNNPRQN